MRKKNLKVIRAFIVLFVLLSLETFSLSHAFGQDSQKKEALQASLMMKEIPCPEYKVLR